MVINRSKSTSHNICSEVEKLSNLIRKGQSNNIVHQRCNCPHDYKTTLRAEKSFLRSEVVVCDRCGVISSRFEGAARSFVDFLRRVLPQDQFLEMLSEFQQEAESLLSIELFELEIEEQLEKDLSGIERRAQAVLDRCYRKRLRLCGDAT